MMFRNPRVRTVLGAGTALAVVAGVGIAVATSSSAAGARYVTATAGTGDVTQSYMATGSITRRNTSEVSFAVDGTVEKVTVSVGDQVDAGDVLAVLDTGELQLAVLNAETSVARAKASLYSAQHPSSASGSGGSGGAAGSSGSSGSSGSTGSTGSTGVTIDPAVLNEVVARVNLAVLAEAGACDAILGAILPEPTATATPTSGGAASAEPTAGATPTATAEPTATAAPTASASATEATPATTEPTTAATDAPVATASASQLAKVRELGDLTDDQLQACADARAEVMAANAHLQTVVAGLTGPRPGTGTSGGRTPSSSSSGSSSSVSASRVASAKADLLQAEQELAAAEEDLANAELRAPISGTVGVVGLAKGDSASAGSITIVGSGSAVVSFELPLATRQLVAAGQSVAVTPAGSTTTLSGTITSIATLAAEGTSGSSPTYATTVSVKDPSGLLATGAKASVLIPVKSATSVLRVPASAVTPTGTGAGTVQVVDRAAASSARTVQVTTGAVGGGWVQITEGLEAGTLVVLADNTAGIPANQSNRRTTTSSSTATAPATVPTTATAVPTTAASQAAPSVQASSTGR